jgi:magnesium transporter
MGDDDGAVRGRLWRNGKVGAEDFDFERISDYLEDDDTLTWIDVCDPDHRILQELAGELVLDPLAVEDAIAHAERAKATRYPTHTFMTVYAVQLHKDADVSGPEGMLSVHKVSARTWSSTRTSTTSGTMLMRG